MSYNIIIINGPNINLLGEREQSQYGSITFDQLKNNCINKAKELHIDLKFSQSNIEGEIVTTIQEAKSKFDVYPSAYANAWLVKTYKKRGGGYKGAKKAAMGGAIKLKFGGPVMVQGKGCGAMMENKRKKTKVPGS